MRHRAGGAPARGAPAFGESGVAESTLSQETETETELALIHCSLNELFQVLDLKRGAGRTQGQVTPGDDLAIRHAKYLEIMWR